MSHEQQNVRGRFLADYLRGLFPRRAVEAHREQTILDPEAGNLLAVSQSLKEALEILSRQRGDIMDSALRVRDMAGIIQAVKRALGMAQPYPSDFMAEVGKGNIAGHKVYTIPGRKDSLSTSVLDDITQIPGTTVTPRPGGIQLELVSSSAADDGSPVGTGAQTVDIHYLDSSGDEQEETVTMNGLGAVTTLATDIADVQWLHTRAVGANGVAVGNISLQGVGGGTVYEYLAAGGNQSLSGRYAIPNGKTGYIVGWMCSAIVKQIDFRLRATVERHDRALVSNVFLFQDAVVLVDAPSGFITMPYPACPAGSVVKISGISAAAGGNAGGSFQIMLVDN